MSEISIIKHMSLEIAKKKAAELATDLIQPHMSVGLGTGSSATYFIEALALRKEKGLILKAVTASSHQSADFAKRLNLPLQELSDLRHVDITVDGADEIDSSFKMIKGRGGAHVREKILASASKELIIIVDETKLVSRLGKGKLPIEMIWFGASSTRSKIDSLGHRGSFRTDKDGSLFLSDNGNLIYDLIFSHPPESPETLHQQIISIPGVVDTGFFLHFVSKVIIGYCDGKTEIRNIHNDMSPKTSF